MKISASALFFALVLVDTSVATAEALHARRRRAISPHTAVLRVKRQNLAEQLRQALVDADASASSIPTNSTSLTSSATPTSSSDDGAIVIGGVEPTSSSTPVSSSETDSSSSTSSTKPTRPSSAVTPTSSDDTGIVIGDPDTSESSDAPTSTQTTTKTTATDDPTSSTDDDLPAATDTGIVIGDPTESKSSSSSASPTRTKDVSRTSADTDSSTAKETDTAISIGDPVEESSTSTTEESSTSTTEESSTSTTEESSTSKTSNTLDATTPTKGGNDDTTTSKPTDSATTSDGLGITIGVDDSSSASPSSTKRPSTRTRTSSSSAPSDGVSISDPESSSEITSPRPTRSASDLPTSSPDSSQSTIIIESSERPPRPPVSQSSQSSDPASASPSNLAGVPSGVFSSSRRPVRPMSDPASESATTSPTGNGTDYSSVAPSRSFTRSPYESVSSSREPSGQPSGTSTRASPTGQASASQTEAHSESSSSSASVKESDSESTTSSKTYYNFVPSSTLMVNTRDAPTSTRATATTTTGSIKTGASAADESIVSLTLPTSLPSSLPAKIIPGDAPSTLPADSVLISIGLNPDTMGWAYTVGSPTLASQVFAYMPQLVGKAIGISEDDVITTALVAYQGLTDQNASALMTVYLAAIPSDQVSNLEAQVKAPNSAFYSQPDAILQQLSDQVMSSFPLMAFTSTEQATIGGNKSDPQMTKKDDHKDNSKTIIAVVASFGSVIVLLAGFLIFRYLRLKRNNGAANLRALQLNRNSPVPSPTMAQTPNNRNVFSGMFQSHHYATSSRHSVGSDSSGSDRSVGGGNRDVQRGISWYSGRYTDFGDDDDGSPRNRSIYGQAITGDPGTNNPFADRYAAGEGEEATMARSEGVRRLKTGQVQISRPQLEGNSLML